MSQGCAWLMTCSKPLCVCVCAVRCNQRHLPGGHSQDHHGLSQHESVYSLFNFLLLVISAFSCPAITSMVDWHYKPVIYLSVILKVQAIENIQLRGIHKPPPCGVMQSPSHWTWKKRTVALHMWSFFHTTGKSICPAEHWFKACSDIREPEKNCCQTNSCSFDVPFHRTE